MDDYVSDFVVLMLENEDSKHENMGRVMMFPNMIK